MGEVRIDTQPPTVAVTMQAGERVDGWYTTPVSLIASGTDGGSGIAGYQASLNNGAWVTFNAAFVVKNGEHTVAIRAVDVAGNASEAWRSPVLRVNSTQALVYPEQMFPHGSPVQGNNTAGVAAAAEVPLVAEAKAEITQPQVISFSNPPKQVGKSGVTASVKTSPGILWGALGASAIAGGAVMLAAAKRKERKEEQKKQQILAAQASAQRTGILLNRKAQQKAAARAAAAKAAEEAKKKQTESDPEEEIEKAWVTAAMKKDKETKPRKIVSPDPIMDDTEAAWLAGAIKKDKETRPRSVVLDVPLKKPGSRTRGEDHHPVLDLSSISKYYEIMPMIYLKGDHGRSESYAENAEFTYTDGSGGDAEVKSQIPSVSTDALVWLRDNTNAIETILGLDKDVGGVVHYDLMLRSLENL